MLTLNTIFEDIKKVPVNQLEELHLFIRELISKNKEVDSLAPESKDRYNKEFVEKIRKSREEIKNGESIKMNLDDLWK